MHGVRQDAPPRLERIDYEIIVDTDEPDRRLELLHDNVKKYGRSSIPSRLAPTSGASWCARREAIDQRREAACSRFRITIR